MTESKSVEPHGLLWVDVETTGLDAKKDEILELAYVYTSFEYPWTLRSEGSYLLNSSGRQWLLSGMVPKEVLEMHTKSGLSADLQTLSECVSPEYMLAQLMAISTGWPGKSEDRQHERVVVAGYSVKFDLEFLREKFPSFAKRLHSHRVFDVSSFAMQCRSLGMPRVPRQAPQDSHRAMLDTRAAMRHARLCAEWLSPPAPLKAGDEVTSIRYPRHEPWIVESVSLDSDDRWQCAVRSKDAQERMFEHPRQFMPIRYPFILPR